MQKTRYDWYIKMWRFNKKNESDIFRGWNGNNKILLEKNEAYKTQKKGTADVFRG